MLTCCSDINPSIDDFMSQHYVNNTHNEDSTMPLHYNNIPSLDSFMTLHYINNTQLYVTALCQHYS